MSIIKIDETKAEITENIVKTRVATLDQLNYDKDSLIRNKKENTQDAIDANIKIDILIADLDEKIASFKTLGLKTAQEVLEAQPIKEPIEEEIINP